MRPLRRNTRRRWSEARAFRTVCGAVPPTAGREQPDAAHNRSATCRFQFARLLSDRNDANPTAAGGANRRLPTARVTSGRPLRIAATFSGLLKNDRLKEGLN